MRINEIKNHQHSSETIDDAMWWIQRWISGSLNDPDWKEGEAENSLNLNQAFHIIQEVVGNNHYKNKTLYRFVSVSEQ